MSHVMIEPRTDLHAVTDWKAGAIAGLIAGIAFLILQMGLVWTEQGLSPWVPPYMIAAMALGPGALPATGTWAAFDLTIIMMAMIIHFPMSIALGLLGAWLVHRLDFTMAVMNGAVLGLLVYRVNFYMVAPLAFPWFGMGRNWIGAFSHIMFGAALSISYIALRTSESADRDAYQ